ncbi:hypothetical protein G7K_5895-t1 [Saitoella complicata NRRL Y-17804]|uniref:Uncharacterized protein n=1 Tax=Saitoella complicata (strain BCRC 22490 / CBS 7301 / JCM 7358 / NBRC 10748 / NRRL Y-17804) TaxID=698492 RepID=A0A0E9NPN4_SAICN|nr:hypothetical protein G7K_5895-t1 [Saitoella complicata NRRL Y-17804]
MPSHSQKQTKPKPMRQTFGQSSYTRLCFTRKAKYPRAVAIGCHRIRSPTITPNSQPKNQKPKTPPICGTLEEGKRTYQVSLLAVIIYNANPKLQNANQKDNEQSMVKRRLLAGFKGHRAVKPTSCHRQPNAVISRLGDSSALTNDETRSPRDKYVKGARPCAYSSHTHTLTPHPPTLDTPSTFTQHRSILTWSCYTRLGGHQADAFADELQGASLCAIP